MVWPARDARGEGRDRGRALFRGVGRVGLVKRRRDVWEGAPVGLGIERVVESDGDRLVCAIQRFKGALE